MQAPFTDRPALRRRPTSLPLFVPSIHIRCRRRRRHRRQRRQTSTQGGAVATHRFIPFFVALPVPAAAAVSPSLCHRPQQQPFPSSLCSSSSRFHHRSASACSCRRHFSIDALCSAVKLHRRSRRAQQPSDVSGGELLPGYGRISGGGNMGAAHLYRSRPCTRSSSWRPGE